MEVSSILPKLRCEFLSSYPDLQEWNPILEASTAVVKVHLRPGATPVLVHMKRPGGQSSPTTLEHIRAGKSTVIRELEQVGVIFGAEIDLLREAYCLRFRPA